jgi:hypothetical protein
MNSPSGGPFLALGQRGRSGLPRRCRSWAALHTKVHLLYIITLDSPPFIRGRTAEDYRRTAEENGWDSEAYEEEDSVQVTKDEPGEAYKQSQQQALDQWTMWVPTSADRACLRTPAL